ncbi:MAG TPA: beta-(1-6) glucans synthase [Pseudolabrys sp.]|nr:beta-(1-6) glucans synthase [Pseudolabrys sp.]
MRIGLACFAASAVVIVSVWAWLGASVPMPHAPLKPGEKLYCLSYAPYRAGQTPFDTSTVIPAAQIDEDMAQLAKVTDCVRIYALDQGLDQVPPLAAKHGLKVLMGIWPSKDHPDKTALQVASAVRLAQQYPDTIRAVVVGNEVLLRGEMTGADLAAMIRSVKAQVKVPVTYADVWEFWLRNPAVAAAADFITIHILPYWEDFPVPAEQAADHVAAIRARVASTFPGKEILIGEVGWPSAGRMREGALPSPANQARVIQDVLALAKQEHFHVNVIEAYDQPWKRALEGTVGGHWGLLDAGTRRPKFVWGEAVSNHPGWRWQAAGGVVFAAAVFGAALLARRKEGAPPPLWFAVTANATVGGILIGWTIANVSIESFDAGGLLRALGLAAVALTSPIVASAAIMRGAPIPRFSEVLARRDERIPDRLAVALGVVTVATMLLAVQSALGLTFDPRYKDFPFAAMTAAVLPLLLHSLIVPRPPGTRGAAELAAAVVLVLSVIYIVPDESLANWQSLWLCAAFIGLALTLVRVRGVSR